MLERNHHLPQLCYWYINSKVCERRTIKKYTEFHNWIECMEHCVNVFFFVVGAFYVPLYRHGGSESLLFFLFSPVCINKTKSHQKKICSIARTTKNYLLTDFADSDFPTNNLKNTFENIHDSKTKKKFDWTDINCNAKETSIERIDRWLLHA